MTQNELLEKYAWYGPCGPHLKTDKYYSNLARDVLIDALKHLMKAQSYEARAGYNSKRMARIIKLALLESDVLFEQLEIGDERS
jgi:hypothetical protein